MRPETRREFLKRAAGGAVASLAASRILFAQTETSTMPAGAKRPNIL